MKSEVTVKKKSVKKGKKGSVAATKKTADGEEKK